MPSSPGLAWVERLEGIGTLDVQVAVTLLVLVIGVLLARIVIPEVVYWLHRGLARLAERENLLDSAETVRDYTPWWASVRVLIWIVQLVVVGLVALSVLAIWGQLELVITLVSLASISMPVVVKLLLTIAVFLIAYVVVDVLDSWLREVTSHSESITQHQEEIAYRVLQIVVLTAVLLAALSLWGVDLGGLLVGAGFLGIVVGMAARQTLGSLIAGFVLMFSRPFEIGDWVEIGEEEGIVTEISIVNTRLENFDGEVVVLPNDVVSNTTIINRSKKGRIRIRVEVGIDYEADAERAQDLAMATVSDLESVLSVPQPQVVTKRLGDSAVVLELRFWIDKPTARRRTRAVSDVLRAVKRAFDDAGIKIPYPQRELLGREETAGFHVVQSGSTETD
jgi:small-conductance mechanosensitive channel